MVVTVFNALFVWYVHDLMLWFLNSGVGGGECVTPVLVRSLKLTHLSTAIINWIGVQTGVHGFDSHTPHKPVVSKTSEADIWLSSYDHLANLRQRGGCQHLSQWKGACFLLNKKEASSGIETSRESLWLPAIGTWGYPFRAYGC